LTHSPDGKHLLTQDMAGEYVVLDAQTGATLADWKSRPADFAVFVADPPRLLWGKAGKLAAFDAGTLAPLWERQFPPDEGGAPPELWVTRFVSGKRLLAGTGSGKAFLLDVDTGEPIAEMRDRGAQLYGGRLTRDGRYATMVSSVAPPLIWDTQTGASRVLAQVRGGRFRVPGVVGDAIVVFGGSSGLLEAWDAASGHRLAFVGHHGSQIRHFEMSPGGMIATASSDNHAALWAANLETRAAGAITALLACKAPWELKGDELVARELPLDCLSRQ